MGDDRVECRAVVSERRTVVEAMTMKFVSDVIGILLRIFHRAIRTLCAVNQYVITTIFLVSIT